MVEKQSGQQGKGSQSGRSGSQGGRQSGKQSKEEERGSSGGRGGNK